MPDPPLNKPNRYFDRIRPRTMSAESPNLVCDALMRLYGACCLVIDEKFRLEYLFGDPEGSIGIPAGKTSLDVRKLIDEKLAPILSASVYRAAKGSEAIVFENIALHDRAMSFEVTLRTQRLAFEKDGFARFIVLIEKRDRSIDESPEARRFSADVKANGQIERLREKLRRTEENLQAAIEELETANEELRAVNEQLFSSREEAQSANEELKSVNQELRAFNREHQKRIEELTCLKNDVFNLLGRTEIGAVFLDRSLRIRKTTPGVASYINAREQDVGRPLSDFTRAVRYPELADDARFVIESSETLVKLAARDNGTPVLVKIFPYVREGGKEAGVVVVFVDIAACRDAERELAGMKDEKDAIMDVIPDVLFYYDIRGKLAWANRTAFAAFRKSPAELMGLDWETVWGTRERRPSGNRILEVLKTGTPARYEITDAGGGVWHARSMPVRERNGRVKAVVECARMVTTEKKSSRFLEEVFNCLPERIAVVDRHGAVVMTNPSWKRYAKREGSAINVLAAGSHFRDICRDIRYAPENFPAKFRKGVAEILEGKRVDFSITYHSGNGFEGCHGMFMVRPLAEAGSGAVITQLEIPETETVPSIRTHAEKIRA